MIIPIWLKVTDLQIYLLKEAQEQERLMRLNVSQASQLAKARARFIQT